MIVKLRLKDIIIPQGLLPRIFGVNEEKVEEYAEAIENGAVFPPIKVWQKPDGTYQVIDGVHRISAYRKLGKEYIEAEIIKDIKDETDFMIWAISENLKHGLPLSKEDKREDTRRLYLKGLSPQQIAILFKVSHQTIYNWIGDLKDEEKAKKEELKQKVIELYNKGYTSKEIANKLSVPDSTIRNWLSEFQKFENRTSNQSKNQNIEYTEPSEEPEDEIDEELGVSKKLISELDELLQAEQETEEHQPQQPAPKKQKKEYRTKPSWETLQEIIDEIEVQFGRIYAIWGLEKLEEVANELLEGFRQAEEAKKLNPKYNGEL